MDALVIADDLTGALEAAAVIDGAEVPVIWDEVPGLLPPAAVVNARTRDLNGGDARRVLSQWSRRVLPPRRLVQKMDSRGRGRFVQDARILAQAFARPYWLVAPALPTAGRVVRGGRILVEGRVERDLRRDLAAEGVSAVLWEPGRVVTPGTVAILDAESDAALRRGVAAWPVPDHETLFVGSRGLCEALGRPPSLPRPTVVGRILVLVGSPIAASRGQLATLAEVLPVYDLNRVPRRLPAADAALSSLCLAGRSEEAIAAAWRTTMRGLADQTCGAVLITGGKTAETVLDAIGAQHLTALGLWPHGTGVGRIVGGPWDGVPLLAKSGGFGPETALLDGYRRLSKLRREGATGWEVNLP